MADNNRANPLAERIGQGVGSGFKKVSEYAHNTDTKGEVKNEQPQHGRESCFDRRMLGIAGATAVAAVVGSVVVSAASAILATGAVVAAGAAGAALYCKRMGYDSEYQTIVGGASKAAGFMTEAGQGFVRGFQQTTGTHQQAGEGAPTTEDTTNKTATQNAGVPSAPPEAWQDLTGSDEKSLI